MGTDNWNELSKKLRDFSPTPPPSIKAAIDQHVSEKRKVVLGQQKLGLYLSLMALALTLGVIYFMTNRQNEVKSDAKLAFSTKMDENNTATQTQGKTEKHDLKTNSEQNGKSRIDKKMTSSAVNDQGPESKTFSAQHRGENESMKKQTCVESNYSTTSKKMAEKSTTSRKKNFTDGKKSPTESKTQKSTGTKKSQNKRNGIDLANKKPANALQSSKVPKSEIDASALNADQTKLSSLKNKAPNDAPSNNEQTDLATKNAKGTFQTVDPKETEIHPADKQAKAKAEPKIDTNVETSQNEDVHAAPAHPTGILTDKKTNPSKHELGVYAGPLFRGKQQNTLNASLNASTGLQLNVYYGHSIKPRLKLNAGISYDRKREKVNHTTEPYDTSYYETVIQLVENPADTSFDTITYIQLQNKTIPGITRMNESVISRYGLTTSITFLAVQRRTWLYSIRFGNVVYFSTENAIRNEASDFGLEMKKWSGAIYLDNFVSKSFGRTNISLGFSANYSYAQSYKWSNFKSNSLFLSPFIGVSYHF